jgi:hypothetical protein
MSNASGAAALLAALALSTLAATARAQEPAAPDHQHMTMTDAPPGWTWMTDGSIFFGYNDQERKFTDFSTWESQNWGMLAGQHPLGRGTFSFDVMMSLEPFTFNKIGSPQVFQTGEVYHGGPIIDRQHPHDLIMGLGAEYRVPRGSVTYLFGADVVGSPALGPTAFMHRASAADNPQAPLIHHFTDSTHITPGVLTAGVESRGVTVEGSWFRGEEPNDNRLNIDKPMFDSWSARATWAGGPWRAQFSGGRLHRPEALELFDLTRLTASIEYDGQIASHPLAASLLWGENREVHGILDGYLFEWDYGFAKREIFYGRAESTARDLLDLGGPDPPGFIEFHRISHIQALTVGYVHDLAQRRWGRIGIGADATMYHVPDNLLEFYGAPHSFHVFVRFRPLAPMKNMSNMSHMH